MKTSADKSVYAEILKERVELYGIDTLMNEEVLSFFTGIPIGHAKKNIDQFGLTELIRFTDSMDLTKPQRKRLELLYLFSKRVSSSKYRDKRILSCSSAAGEFFVSEMQFLSYEVFMIAYLNTQNRLISLETVSVGTINEAQVYPREIVKLALSRNANSVILAHNHPSASLQPSSHDIETTRKITAALKTVSVSVIDHIIVAENQFTSFAEKGLLSV
jgi:DNA repair protein RadC